MSNTRFDRLVAKLRELFQLDQPELDFGVYRILHARSEEITAFLENDLLPQVKNALAAYQSADRATLQAELDEAIAQARSLGADPDSLPKVRELRERLENEAVDLAALEADVYDHLYRFFSRYYHEGDFISLRRYKEGVYAIPYEGEEVKLYWANHDQYYIKTAEYLRDYAFRLRPDDAEDPMRVHFRLVDAAEGEHGNIKEVESKKRVFVLAGDDFIAEEPGENGAHELVLRFEYRPATVADWPEAVREGKDKPPTQKDLLDAAVERVLAVNDPSLVRWISALAEKHIKADGSVADYSRLRAHLDRYTARNTFDYFIHKDLGGFLRRELDFYIKSEVMCLDDIEDESAPRVEQYLSKVKVIRRIALKIIDFLAQLEDFQKKLWLKKKFVSETSWCVSIATILGIEDEAVRNDLLAEIAANDAQRVEWVQLHGIDGLQADLEHPAYSEPLTPEFVAAYPTLMIDTRHFEAAFVERLIASLGDLDELTDGLLVNAENLQAMRLVAARFAGTFDCAYIDPPYNTGNDAFVYKDGYSHSSWIAFMENRIAAFPRLARNDAALFVSIDDNEVGSLISLVRNHCPSAELVTLIAAQLNPRGRTLDKYLAKTHEYVAVFAVFGAPGAIHEIAKSEKALAEYRETDEKGAFRLLELRNRNPVFSRSNRPNLFYPFFADPNSGTVRLEADTTHTIQVLPRNSRGVDGCWTWSREKAQKNITELVARSTREGVWRVYRKDRLLDKNGLAATTKVKSIWVEKEINNENGKEMVRHLLGESAFDFPKSVSLVERCAEIGMTRDGWFIDFFAGSGTSGHSIVSLNRRDGGTRRFLLVEMGRYFDTVLVPRLKKVTFTPEWKDGRPKRLVTKEEAERSPRVFKIIRLESYEDTLNNLELRRTDAQQSLLDTREASGADGLREQYVLRYMLDVESRGSASLLNVERFIDPRCYTLKVKRPGSDESREVAVDLIETFNWLLGLRVRHIAASQSFSAAFRRDNEGRLRLDGRLVSDADGAWWFRTVEGETPDGRRALVIWRNRPGGDDAEGIEQDNLVLDEWFARQGYSAKDSEFDLIYVNGGNNLENLKGIDDRWKVRLIEEEFFRLMFDVEDV